jgi:hypothetical protein
VSEFDTIVVKISDMLALGLDPSEMLHTFTDHELYVAWCGICITTVDQVYRNNTEGAAQMTYLGTDVYREMARRGMGIHG